jgi:hypothetical protein
MTTKEYYKSITGTIKVAKFGFFIDNEYYLDDDLPSVAQNLSSRYGSYNVHPYSHLQTKTRMGSFRKRLYSVGVAFK